MGKETETKEIEVVEAVEDTERKRPQRKTTYERKLKSTIPDEIKQMFLDQGLTVRYQPYRLANVVQGSIISEFLRDGWDFVKSSDLPDWYANYFEVEDWRARDKILTAHDLVLMQHTTAYVRSQQEYYEGLAAAEIASVDTNVLAKKGYLTKGSSSSVTHSEPRFKD